MKVYSKIAAHFAFAAGAIYFVAQLTAAALPAPSSPSDKGRIRVSGSTAAVGPVQAAARVLQMDQQIACDFETKDASDGVDGLLTGTADVVLLSRQLRRDETERARELGIRLETLTIGSGGVAIVVHPTVGRALASISLEQIRDIFVTGKINRWEQLCGEKVTGAIEVVRCPQASGASQVLLDVLNASDTGFLGTALEVEDGESMTKTLSKRAKAIGYLWSTYSTNGLASLAVDSQGQKSVCNDQSIRQKKYPFLQDFTIVCNGHLARGLPLLNFLATIDGQQALNNAGMVTAMSFTAPTISTSVLTD